jgi:hypothetical protein
LSDLTKRFLLDYRQYTNQLWLCNELLAAWDREAYMDNVLVESITSTERRRFREIVEKERLKYAEAFAEYRGETCHGALRQHEGVDCCDRILAAIDQPVEVNPADYADELGWNEHEPQRD